MGFVLIRTIKKSEALRFEKEGYAGRAGSSLLHPGLVVMIFNFRTGIFFLFILEGLTCYCSKRKRRKILIKSQ